MSNTDVSEEDDISWGQTLRNYATSIGADVLSLPTTAAAIPQYLWSGAKALYNTYGTEQKFLEEFAKQNQVEGAQKNIIDHLQTVRNTWQQQEPDISQKELDESLDNYMKSKEFEDFTHSQLSGAVWADTKLKDVIRNVAGDTRTAEQRPMGEDIAGILGTAGIGTSASVPAKLANLASRSAMTAAIFNNPVSKGVIRAAELTTPVTIPYTPANVAANAVVGVGIDQAFRYAQGKDTFFTDGKENDVKIGALAGTGAGVAAITSLALAMRGHNTALLKQAMSDTAKSLEEQGPLSLRTPAVARTGEASVVAGAERRTEPVGYNETLNPTTQWWRWVKDKMVHDESSLISGVRDVAGREAANDIEMLFRTHSGAVNTDRIGPAVRTVMHDFDRTYSAMSNEEQRAFNSGINAMNYKVERDSILEAKQSHIEALQEALAKKGITPKAKEHITSDLDVAKKELADFNDPANIDARHALPQIEPRVIMEHAERAAADINPVQMRAKEAFAKTVADAREAMVKGHLLTRQEADVWAAKAPYYIPPINDPLGGATGINRIAKGILYASRQYYESRSRGSGGSVGREIPLARLPTQVPKPQEPGMETRITAQLNPASALKVHVERSLNAVSRTYLRNMGVRTMAFKHGIDAPGMETDLYKNSHMVQVIDPKTNAAWHFGSERNSNWARAQFNNPRNVVEWNMGHFRFWKLGDAEWARLFRQEPQLMHGLAVIPAAFTRLYKQFTTGYGNPGWSPIGAAYDLTMGLITTHHNRAFGPLSYAVRRWGPNWASIPFKFLPDPTALVGVVYHAVKGVIDVQVATAARAYADAMTSLHPAIMAMKQAMGDTKFYAAMENALRAAHWSHELATNRMLREGLTHGHGPSVDNIVKVRDHFNVISDKIPGPLRAVVNFYKNVVDAIYTAPKRMFYTENYGLLHKKFGGNIPEHELEKLIHETRALGGDMTMRPGSILQRDIEAAIFPYMTQTKLGTYHLLRQMSSPETAWYVLPRLALLTTAYAQGLYWRTHWNEESSHDLWERTPGYERYRHIYIPKWDLFSGWFNGANLPFDRNLFYKVTIAPDFTFILAGAAAMLQAFNWLPTGGQPKPLYTKWMDATWDSLRPAMPPAMQALLAMNNMTLDPATADQRAGQMIRNFSNPYRAGPQVESATPLGEISTSNSLLLKALFGTMGSHIAQALDVAMHATKYDVSVGGGISPKQAYDFNRGLVAATNEVYEKVKERIPDVPVLWSGPERSVTMTPAWEHVGEATGYMRSIKGMRDATAGKTAQLNRQLAAATGSIQQKVIADMTLLKIADDVSKFQNPTGPYGMLKAQYNQLSNINRGVTNNYTIAAEERQKRHVFYTKQMQDNLMQRSLAINLLEQQIEEKYGKYLKPLLAGRGITMQSLDAIMRERLGVPAPQQGAAQAQDEEG